MVRVSFEDGMGLGQDDSDSPGHRHPGLWKGRDFGFRGPGSGHVTCAVRARSGAGELRPPTHSRHYAFEPQGFECFSSSHCVLALSSHSWGSMMSHVPERKQVYMS